eukprot:GEZU01021706.1.p1 GENE.GEZU01021706.1~~GEZU01021706.1.p1  ORF type:complete len:697 (-),score=132.10 GEZU01021706.1:358-2448(-)
MRTHHPQHHHDGNNVKKHKHHRKSFRIVLALILLAIFYLTLHNGSKNNKHNKRPFLAFNSTNSHACSTSSNASVAKIQHSTRASQLITDSNEEERFDFTILHTNDLHSHFDGIGPDRHPEAKKGHFARLAYLIRAIQQTKRQLGEPVLTLDAGDFSAGTLYTQIAFADSVEHSPELEFLHYCNYDAITFGNHEFDYPTERLALAMRKAMAKGAKIPFVCANLIFREDDPLAQFYCDHESPAGDGIEWENTTLSNDNAKSIYCDPRVSTVNIRPYRIFELQSAKSSRVIRVGVLGLFGLNSAKLSQNSWGREKVSAIGFSDSRSRVEFSKYSRFAQKMVNELRKEKKVDLVVVLAHAGQPEDIRLVREVNGIDIHISSHTHRQYLIQEGDTIITQTGAFGANLGNMELSLIFDRRNRNKKPRLELRNHPSSATAARQQLNQNTTDPTSAMSLLALSVSHIIHIPINNSIPMDPHLASVIEDYKADVNHILHRHLGSMFEYDTPIGTLQHTIPLTSHLGNYVVSGIREELNGFLQHNFHDPVRPSRRPIDVYVSGLGFLRHELKTVHNDASSLSSDHHVTSYQFSDMFKLLASSTSPIVTFYLKKSQFMTMLSFLDIYSSFLDKDFVAIFSQSLQYKQRELGFYRSINDDSWPWRLFGGWRLGGIPFVNRIYDVTLDGRPYEEWPELLHVGTSFFLAQ